MFQTSNNNKNHNHNNTNDKQQQQLLLKKDGCNYGSTNSFHIDSNSSDDDNDITSDIENYKQQRQQQQQQQHNDKDDVDCHTESSSSGKTIGMIGSLAIAVNSLAGPAILQLPFQYQQSGLIPTTVCLIGIAILSAFCSLHMANTVSKMPNNHHFDQCIEFSDPFRYFWNNTMYKVTHVLFFLTATCLNVAAIVDTAEVVDSILGLQYSSYALSFDGTSNAVDTILNTTYETNNITTSTMSSSSSTTTSGIYPFMPSIKSWYHAGGHACTSKEVKLGRCDPYSDLDEYGNLLLTAGYVITAIVFLPICLKDLKENTIWQIFGFGLLLSLSTYFCISFVSVTTVSSVIQYKNVSLWGKTYSDMLGVIMFNFALVLAIPAWLHEKKQNVSVHKTVVQSTFISTSLYIAVGVLGALAIPHVNVNMLSPMVSGAYGSGIQIASSFFAFFIIGLDIPLFSVLTRYNLVHSGLCSETIANLFVVYIPWGISWIFYQGDSIGILLSWGGVILTSAIAFILPLYISIRALQYQQKQQQKQQQQKDRSNNTDNSFHVYGFALSKQKQVQSLYVLLMIAITAVCLAIIGQIMASEEKEQYLDSKEYINGASQQVQHVVHQSMNHVQTVLDNLKSLHMNTLITTTTSTTTTTVSSSSNNNNGHE